MIEKVNPIIKYDQKLIMIALYVSNKIIIQRK